MKKIPLTQGKFALVDNEDYSTLSKFKWYAHKNGNTYYALGTTPGRHNLRKKLHMHRVILNSNKGQIVDHINGNGLDNRRVNIRSTDARGNSQNREINRKGKLVGAKRTKNGRYESRTWINGKYIHLGVFSTEKEASNVYFSYLNNLIQ